MKAKELRKEDIIKVLENNTVWFEALYEDLIHKGRFEAIADEIVNLSIHSAVESKDTSPDEEKVDWSNLENSGLDTKLGKWDKK